MQTKTILVTGGSRGIGRAICRALQAEGALVIDASVDSEDSAAEKPAPGRVYARRTDVSNERSVLDLFDWLDARFPPLDVLINNAGVFLFKPLTDISFDEWRRVMSVNADGLFLCTREALRRMLPRGQGQIINLGSVAGAIPLSGNAAYGTSKAAVKMFTRLLNHEYGSRGIRATLLSLGAVDTGLWDDQPGFERGEMIRPEQVASAVRQIILQNTDNRVEELQLLPSFRFKP